MQSYTGGCQQWITHLLWLLWLIAIVPWTKTICTRNLDTPPKPSCKKCKIYGWRLKNQFETCESCALAKLQQKDTNKEKRCIASEMPGKQLFINISHVKSHSFGSSQYWRLAINDVMVSVCF